MRRTAKSFALGAATMAALMAALGVTAGCGSYSSFGPVPPVSVVVTGPGDVRLNGSAQFSASVSNPSNPSVTWEVNGVAGGAVATGTISTAGLYTAPAALPSPNTVTITAVSEANPADSGSATETVLNLVPVLSSGTAAQTGTAGFVSLDVLGTGFVSGIQLQVGGVGVTTTFVSATEATATFAPAAGVTSLAVTAMNPNSGGVASNSITVAIPQISVTVTGAGQVRAGGTVQFIATVTNTSNTAVTWQVNGVTGGSAATGTISANGLFTAPAVSPSPNAVTITAISQAMPTASASASETILNLVPVLVSGTAAQTATAGVVSLDVIGSGFVSGLQLQVGGVAATTTFVSATEATATFTPAAGVTSVSVMAINPSSGGGVSNAITVTIPQITVTVTGAGQVRVGETTQFAATVTNTPNTTVTWQVNGVTGGSGATGTISASGLFTAPAALPAADPVTITAVSQAAASATGSASETILNLIPVLTSGTAVQTGSGGVVSLNVLGAVFVSGIQLQVGGVAVTTTLVSATQATATFTPAAGVTSVSVTAINPSSGGGVSNAITVTIPQIGVTVSGAAQVRVGQTVQFTATVTNSPNTTVTWQVNGITGGSAATGTISASGLYTAPAVLPSPDPVTILAVSQALASATGSASELVLNLVPVLTSGTATQTGSGGVVSLDVLGAGFVSGIQLQVGGVAATTTFVSATEATATFTPAAGVTSVMVTAINPNSGGAVSNAISVNIPQITVTVTGAGQVRVGGTVQFAATVTNSPNTAVTWQVNGVTGGSAATGTISTGGLFTAPATLPTSNPVTITAVSQAVSSATGSASETILNLVPVLVSGTAAQTGSGGVVSLSVTGTAFASGIQLQVGGAGVSTTFVSATQATATFTPAAGVTSVSVTATNPNSGGAVSNAITVPIPQITVSVTGAAQVRVGQTVQLTATVTNSPNTAVTWQVNGVTGGSAATGTISASGLYTAPATLPTGNPVTITAVSQALASATGSLQETIWNPIPTLISGTATPTGGAGALLLDLRGTGFVTGAQIQVNGVAQAATSISATEVQTTITPTAGETSVVVAVIDPNPGSATSNSLTIAFPVITVTVTGASSTRLGQTTQFTATVMGTSNTAVTWQVNGVTGGSATTGTISASGLFTAPAALPSPNVVTIIAISQESAAAMGSLQETILNLVPTLSAVVPTLTNTAGTIFLDVRGTNFAGGSQIQVSGMNLNTTLISSTEMQADYQPPTGATTITVTASTPNDGGVLSNALTVPLPTLYAYQGALPADEVPSPYFSVSAAGLPVHTYQAQARSVNFYSYKSAFTGQYYYPDSPYQGTYAIMSFASVQLNGLSQVAITFPAGYPTTGAITNSSQVRILPTGAIDPATITVSNNTIVFTVSQTGTPTQLTVEVDGDYLNSLHLFVNPYDVVPTGGTQMTPGYITQATIQSVPSPFVFGPGEYWVNGNLNFRNSSDIYLADGAIIKWVTPFYPQLNTGPMIILGGDPANANANMYLHGSGIIDGQAAQQYAANTGSTPGCGYGTELVDTNNLTLTATNKAGIDGVILRNSCIFNMPISSVIGYPTNHFVVNNVKILGFEGNSDGIDLFTDQYVDVTHSFLRTADDLIVVYQVNTPQTYPTTNITVTNNVLWNELAHALVVGAAYNATQASDPVGVDGVVFDHNDIIHDTGKAFLIGHFNSFPGTVKNITFSNITIEETRAAIGIVQNPTYGDTDNPGIVGAMTFSNININAAQQVQTVNTYVVPVPNIQFLVQLPYGNPYVGNGTTTGAMPASIQGPIMFNNVYADGYPVTSYYLSPGYYDQNNNPVAQNVIAEGVTLRNATYGTFIFEPNQVSGDMFTSLCNGYLCTLIP